jgi:predicted ATPase
MITSCTIKNFRSFNDVTLNSLERINLIIGKNFDHPTFQQLAAFIKTLNDA